MPWEAAEVGGGSRLRAHESEDLPTAARSTARGAGCGVFEGKTAGDAAAPVATSGRARRGCCDAVLPCLSPATGPPGSCEGRRRVHHAMRTHCRDRHRYRRCPCRGRLRTDPPADRHRHERDQAQWRHRAGGPEQDRPRDPALLRRPACGRSDARGHAHHFRPLQRRHHPGTGRAVDPHRRAADRRGARVRPPGRAPAGQFHRQGSIRPGNPRVLAVGRPRPRGGPDQRAPAQFRAGQRAQAQRCGQPGLRPQLRLLRPAHAVRPLPAAPPAHPQGDRDAAAVLPAHRQRAVRGRARGAGAVPAAGQPGLPAVQPDPVQRRHQPRAAVVVLPAGFAAGFARVHLCPLRRHRAAVQVQRRHRRELHPGAFARFADQVHQRPFQRHRAVAEDARLLGRRGQPGRQAQGRGLRLPGNLACRHRGLPGAARQRRRRCPPHPQPQPRQLGAGPVHAAGGGRPAVVAVRSARGAGIHRPVRRGVRARLPAGRGAGQGGQDRAGAQAVRADDAHPGRDRQRLDDLQGQVQQGQQPDPARRQRHPPVQPVHRDPGSHLGRGDGGVQPGLDQPRQPPGRAWRFRFRQARRDRAPGRAPARPGDRPELLPDRDRAPRQPALAPGRPGLHGPAGRVFPQAPAVRLGRRARAVGEDRRGDLLPRAGNLVRAGAGARPPPLVQRHPRRQRRAAV